MSFTHIYDGVHWYMNELTSRVVAESGIPSDRFHLGKIILRCFKDDPEFVSQIDGGTGESETAGSLMKRSIQCAISLKNMGFKRGDVMVLMAPNHLDLSVPFYAAVYLGIIVAPIDRTCGVEQLKNTFTTYNPKVVFCQNEKVADIQDALKNLNQDAKIVTFDNRYPGLCLDDLLKTDDKTVANFKAEDFNAEDTIGFLIPTSGTTGAPKGAAVTYKGFMISGPSFWVKNRQFPSPTRMSLTLTPLQWLTAFYNFVVSPYMKYTRLQTSKMVSLDHIRELINKYRPTYAALSTTMVMLLLKPGEQGPCDMSCFDVIMIGGSAVHEQIIAELKKGAPNSDILDTYAMTELTTTPFQGEAPPGSCGRPIGIYQYKLVDLITKEEITKPNQRGELWITGPGMFKEYYNNPAATKEAFSEDGWFKTGDLFCKDEYWNFYFVERISLLLKYKNNLISPSEIEEVIRRLPGVMDVAVTSIQDPESGDLPVACIVPRPGHTATAQQIKDIVKNTLDDTKQLRGGVAFIDAMPTLSSTKVNKTKLRELLQSLKIE